MASKNFLDICLQGVLRVLTVGFRVFGGFFFTEMRYFFSPELTTLPDVCLDANVAIFNVCVLNSFWNHQISQSFVGFSITVEIAYSDDYTVLGHFFEAHSCLKLRSIKKMVCLGNIDESSYWRLVKYGHVCHFDPTKPDVFKLWNCSNYATCRNLIETSK